MKKFIMTCKVFFPNSKEISPSFVNIFSKEFTAVFLTSSRLIPKLFKVEYMKLLLERLSIDSKMDVEDTFFVISTTSLVKIVVIEAIGKITIIKTKIVDKRDDKFSLFFVFFKNHLYKG